MTQHALFVVEGPQDEEVVGRLLGIRGLKRVKSESELDVYWGSTIPRKFPYEGDPRTGQGAATWAEPPRGEKEGASRQAGRLRGKPTRAPTASRLLATSILASVGGCWPFTGTDESSCDLEPGGLSSGSAVCQRWAADRGDLGEGQFTGDVDSCDPGDLTGSGRTNTLRVINLYRYLAAQPPLTAATPLEPGAQACALLLDANDSLSHWPPASWDCYSDEAGAAAGISLVSTQPAVAAVAGYMVDTGHESTLGHRRILLSTWISGVGVGSTTDYSCHSVDWAPYLDGTGLAQVEWLAWPPPGEVPVQALCDGWGTVDDAGWSLQSDTLDLAGATVTVREGSGTLPVTIRNLEEGYGSTTAISFIPDGWRTAPGRHYTVEVGAVSAPFSYVVEVVDCG